MVPKVLVGCPTSSYHEYCLEDYAKSVKKLTYKNYDILLVDNSNKDRYSNKLKRQGLNVIKGPYFDSAIKRIVTSRNILRDYVLDKGYDYFLSLESDIIPPTNIIENLVKHQKEVVSSVYFNNLEKDGKIQTLMLLWVNRDNNKELIYHVSELELNKPRLIEVAACGLGCVLIKRDVLDEVKFRYKESFNTFDDMWFSIDVRKAGFKIYGDVGIICKHLFLNRPWEWKELKL